MNQKGWSTLSFARTAKCTKLEFPLNWQSLRNLKILKLEVEVDKCCPQITRCFPGLHQCLIPELSSIGAQSCKNTKVVYVTYTSRLCIPQSCEFIKTPIYSHKIDWHSISLSPDCLSQTPICEQWNVFFFHIINASFSAYISEQSKSRLSGPDTNLWAMECFLPYHQCFLFSLWHEIGWG